jgi:two-component system cell cycle sensor histidine kinase/response regulator CckA
MSGGSVLVVDDDPDIRTFVETILVEEGIEAVVAPDAQEALRCLAERCFDLLLTDIRMPDLDGFDLVQRARRAYPELRVLFMSGYSREYRLDPERDEFVAKPFRPRELLGCVYEILSRGRS